MPGFAIHLAVAKEYIKKHKKEIKCSKQFLYGAIAPDLYENKEKSHYGNYGGKHVGLAPFVTQTEIDLTDDFGKGYFLHLLTDELFYYHYFKRETRKVIQEGQAFYDDYDCLNKRILKYYRLTNIPEEVKDYVALRIEKRPRYISYKKLKKFISNISKISLKVQQEGILAKNDVKI